MKILLCHTTLRSGGVESMVVNLANELCKNHDVSICLIYETQNDDICLKRLSSEVKVFSLGKKKAGLELSLWLKLIKAFKKYKYDAIQLNGFFFYYFPAIFLLHGKRNFFYTVHNDAKEENRSWDNYILPIKKMFFKKQWMVPITISNESQRSFYCFYHIDSHLIYNGVPERIISSIPLYEYRQTKNTKLFLNPARISEQKNQIMLCQAFSHLIKQGHDVSLLIAGSNDDTSIYENLKPFLCERIRYIGEVSNIIELLSSVDAMCLSSLYEGMPVTVLEALSVGCIPICTPVGGIIDVIQNGYNGFISRDTSLNSYIISLSEYLESDSLNTMKSNCMASFSNYNIVNTADQYSQLFMHYH